MLAFFSVSQETIDSIGKSTNKVENYKSVIKKIHDHGMRVEGALIFGFDTDTTKVFDDTIDTIKNWDLDLVDISILTPYPGTPLFDYLDNDNRILTRDWELYDSIHVVHKPKQMTPEELADGVQKVWEELYSPLKTIKRAAYSIKLGKYPLISSVLRNSLYYRVSKKALVIPTSKQSETN